VFRSAPRVSLPALPFAGLTDGEGAGTARAPLSTPTWPYSGLPLPLGDPRLSNLSDSATRSFPEVPVERAESAAEPCGGSGDRSDRGLSPRDVVAPRLKNPSAALQQVGPLIRLNGSALGNVGEAGLGNLRRDAGLGHPRPGARREPVQHRIHTGALEQSRHTSEPSVLGSRPPP